MSAKITLTYSTIEDGTELQRVSRECRQAAESHDFTSNAMSFVNSNGLFAADGGCVYTLDDVMSTVTVSFRGNTVCNVLSSWSVV